MRNPPGYGSIVDLGKNRRKPLAVRVPNGKKFNKIGKEIQAYKYIGYFERTSEGKANAMLLLSQYNAGIAVNITPVNVCPTFKELSDIWFEKHLNHIKAKKGDASSQLYYSYKSALKKCSPIYHKKINCIKYQDIQDIADTVSKMSSSTVNNVKTALFGTFDLARKQKYISENFINDVEFIHKKSSNRIHSSFTRDELSLLWDNQKDKNIQIVLIMVYTGLRIEELMSMKTKNVHLSKKYMIGGVKTENGKNRIIPISNKIFPYISELYNENNNYLLPNEGGRFNRNLFLVTIWEPAMAKLKMDHLPHDTRYTCASLMDRAGVNENSKKSILGHAKEGMTNQVYVEKDIVDLLEAINMI